MAEIKTIKAITLNGIEFTDGFTIADMHEQDCCENVFADWEYLLDECPVGSVLDVNRFERVPDAGIKIGGYFIPCYNQQNGYYSSDLTVIFRTADGWEKQIDITDCVKDEIF